MGKLWILTDDHLPSPQTGYDLALWCTRTLPSPVELRSWAGWSETPLIAGSVHGHVESFTRDLREWPATELSMGQGRVWRFQNRYLAWIDSEALVVPEAGRGLAMAGVDLMVGESPGDYPTPFLDPLWRTVQANQMFGLAWGARPSLYLPCEVDPNQAGWLDLERAPSGSTVSLDFQELEQARRLFPIRQGLRARLYRQECWWTT